MADALGAPDAAAYDLLAGCTGFMYALAQAYGMLAVGLATRALVVGGDVLSKILDWNDRSTLVLFGDGVGAVVMEPVVQGGFLGFELGADGAGGEHLCFPGSGSRRFDEPESFVTMNGREVFKFATRVMVSSATAILERVREHGRRRRRLRPHQANKRIIDHALAKLGIPEEKTVVNVDRYGNTSSGSIPLALADARADGRLRDGELVLMTGMGAGLTWGSALVEWTSADDWPRMEHEQGCVLLPRQGSLEAGMGREIAEAVPDAMDVYRVGSRGVRARPRAALLRRSARGARRDRGAAAGARRDEPRDPRRRPRARASSRTSSSATRSASSPRSPSVGALGTAEAIGLVRERGLAMAEAARQRPGAMAAILGLEDDAVENLCRKILGVWPANYNCPGQIVVSGESDAVEECCAEAESLGARRAIRLKVSGAFHSPLVARAADRLKPAIDKFRFADPVAPFMSTVTAKIEPAQRLGSLLVDQLTAPVRFTQAAHELVRDGVTTFVEIGPGNVLSGLVKRIDRGVRTISVNDLASLEKAKEALASR